VLTLSEVQSIASFINGTSYINPFWWTPWDEATAYLWCLDWTNSMAWRVTPINANTFTLRMILRQVYDLQS
jgi:hypothetical protein